MIQSIVCSSRAVVCQISGFESRTWFLLFHLRHIIIDFASGLCVCDSLVKRYVLK